MLEATVVHNVADRMSPDEQGVCQELAVASPRHSLGAHESAPFALEQQLHFLHDVFELGRKHEVRVGPKRAHLPGCVRRIGGRSPKPAKVAAPNIGDPLVAQGDA